MSDLDAILAEKQRLTKRARASKRKGSKGEVDVMKLAVAAGFPDCRRNFGSGARGGNDLIGVEGLAIECKRQESLNIHKAFEQASQAAKPTEIPVVAFKRNLSIWLATLPLEQFFAVYAQSLKAAKFEEELREAHTWMLAQGWCDCEYFEGIGTKPCRFAEALEATT